MNPKLGIVILHFQDVAQARRFYAETLGLHVIDDQSNEHFVTLQSGGDGLIGLSGAPSEAAGVGSSEVGFEVEDVDHMYQEWQAKGVTLLTQPADFPFGRAFDAQDPEGHRLNIYKPRSLN